MKNEELNHINNFIVTINLFNLNEIKNGDVLLIDFSQVNFIKCPSLIFLLMLVKRVFNKSQNKIILKNIPNSEENKIYSYLERSDFLKITNEWHELDNNYSNEYLFSRIPNSSSILEITQITKQNNYCEYSSLLEGINLHTSLILDDQIITKGKFITILGELICNIQEWSEGDGFIFIQKYNYATYISISDDGIGIFKSLENQKKDPNNKKILKELKTEHNFFEFAFTENASRSSSGGLNGIIRSLQEFGKSSYLYGISGSYSYYKINNKLEPKINKLNFEFKGTFINIKISNN